MAVRVVLAALAPVVLPALKPLVGLVRLVVLAGHPSPTRKTASPATS
jgi:hypothetical protein